MPSKSYWMDHVSLPRFPRLAENIDVDVVIVGGGITGITAALLLKKAGKKVALLERDRCAHVDTGHTTAHLTYVTDIRLSELVKTFGKDHAQAAWDAGRAGMQQIQTLVEQGSIDCHHSIVPGYLHAPWQEIPKGEKDRLQEDAELATELGFDAKFVESVPIAKRPGIRFADQAEFHPLRYLAGLLPQIPGDGSHVFEHSEATDFEDKPLSVKANECTIRCNYLVLATHVPPTGTRGMLSAALLQTKLAALSTYAMGARLPKGSTPPAIFSDTSKPYYYLRVDQHARHDYAILGGEDHKTGQENDADARYARLEKLLHSIFADAEVDARWTGQVIETPDGLPYIGEAGEHQFVATGFAGNGMTFGTLGGMMAADAALDRKNPWQDLFAVNRKKLSATWDYLKENIDYPYYLLKDKLTGTWGTSLSAVKRGEGKILKLEGQRLAVYHGSDGKVTTLSPVCTHMGCTVHWNKADSTWDCPCHGSRFQPTGQVLSGPAETPLEEVSLAEKK